MTAAAGTPRKESYHPCPPGVPPCVNARPTPVLSGPCRHDGPKQGVELVLKKPASAVSVAGLDVARCRGVILTPPPLLCRLALPVLAGSRVSQTDPAMADDCRRNVIVDLRDGERERKSHRFSSFFFCCCCCCCFCCFDFVVVVIIIIIISVS